MRSTTRTGWRRRRRWRRSTGSVPAWTTLSARCPSCVTSPRPLLAGTGSRSPTSGRCVRSWSGSNRRCRSRRSRRCLRPTSTSRGYPAHMTVDWLVLIIVAGLACYRATRLVVLDDFPLVAVPRRWIIGDPYHIYDHESGEWRPERRHEGRWFYWFGELISCPWCASGWIALTEV